MRTIRLAVTGPLPAKAMLAALAAHSLPGVQETEIQAVGSGGAAAPYQVPAGRPVPVGPAGTAAGTVRRVLELAGQRVPIEVDITDDEIALRVPAAESALRVDLAVATVRRWLDLDLDPSHVADALGDDPRIGPLLRARPGLRIVGHPDPFEAAVTSVLGQRVSIAAARVLGARFVELFATEQVLSGAEWPVALRPFPGPDRVAAADPLALRAAVGTTTARARAIVALAQACVDGLDLASADHARTRAQLLAIPGIGPWTVEYLAVRVLGDRDAFPAGDLVLQRALGVSSPAEAERIAAPWRPRRAYALFHLWTAETYDDLPEVRDG